MNDANPVTYDAPDTQTTVPTTAARAVARRPHLAAVRAYSLPAADRPAAAAGWQVREEPEYFIPDILSEKSYESDPELIEAADAHTEGQREAMALLDEAENLVAVLLASVADEGDSRAAQSEAVLKVVKKKLKKAHIRIDRQEDRHRNLFVAYFELKGQKEEGEE